ncbi:MAG: hypothetical protein ABI589_00235 [Burkholderiales bacterium]
MKTRHVPSDEANNKLSGLRPFAAVCALALAAFGATACSGRVAPPAPLQTSNPPAPAAWPKAGSDPSVPPAAQALQGRVFDDAEPAPTF